MSGFKNDKQIAAEGRGEHAALDYSDIYPAIVCRTTGTFNGECPPWDRPMIPGYDMNSGKTKMMRNENVSKFNSGVALPRFHDSEQYGM